MESKTKKLILVTLGIILISISISLGIILSGQGAGYLLASVLGLGLLIKYYKFLRLEDVHTLLTLLILGSLYFFYHQHFNFVMIFMLSAAYLGAKAAIRAQGLKYSFRKNNWKRTGVIILGFGGCLALINSLLFLTQGIPLDIHLTLDKLLMSFVPGIFEEVICRLTYMAVGLSLLGSWPKGRIQTICFYLLMVVPHVLWHYSGPISIFEASLQGLIFGLPLALLMRKLDLVTAIGSHSLIDLVRFILFNV